MQSLVHSRSLCGNLLLCSMGLPPERHPINTLIDPDCPADSEPRLPRLSLPLEGMSVPNRENHAIDCVNARATQTLRQPLTRNRLHALLFAATLIMQKLGDLMNKRVTLKDIAHATGVHVSTVSRALDPKRDTPLTDDVVLRIRQAAEKLGYRPNRIASSLRTQRTMTIGVMIPDITNMIFPPIVRGIESVMEPLGYASIIVNTDSQRGREQRLVEILQDRGVDGIIHTAVLLEDPTIERAAGAGLPVVTLNRRIEGTHIPYIINDEAAGISAVFNLLYDLGHRHIAHLAGPQLLSTGQLRLNAFRAAAADRGLDAKAMTIVEAAQFHETDGRRSASEILLRAPETTAILCANDRLALGAIDHCRNVGLSCPADISITGFNDMPLLELIPPRLTTVRIQQFEAGAAAARLMAAILAGQGEDVPVETILPVLLVERDSVAAPRSAGMTGR